MKRSDWIMIVVSLAIVAGTILVLEKVKADNSKAEQGTEVKAEAEMPVEKESSQPVPGGSESAE